MAVRRNDTVRLKQLNRFIDRHRADIERILDDFHVPRLTAREQGT